MRSSMNVVGQMYGVVIARMTVTSVTVGIQYSRITMIIIVINKTNNEKIVNKVTIE